MNRLSLNPFMTLLATFMCVLLASWIVALAVSRPPASKGHWVHLQLYPVDSCWGTQRQHDLLHSGHIPFRARYVPHALRK